MNELYLVKFGDIARNVSENEYKPKEKGLDRCVGLEHLDPGSLKIRRWSPITPEMSFTRRFSKGQILFGKRRAYQKKVALADFDGICSSDILVIEAKKENFVPELLPFIVQDDRFFEYAVGTSSGSLSPRTKWKFLADYEILLPTLEEQRRIATTLWAAEDCIMKGERFVAAAERAKQVLMGELFSKGIETNPHNWKLYPLAELCLLIADCPHSTPDFVDKGFLVVRNFNVKSGRLDLTNAFYTTEKEYLSRIQKAKPEERDILFSREAPCGEACQVPHNLRLSLGQRMMLIRADPNIVDSKFLLYSLYSEYVTRNIDATSIGQTVTRMNVADVKKLKIPLPPLPEQRQIAAILTRSDETIAAARANVGAVKALKMKMINETLRAGV